MKIDFIQEDPKFYYTIRDELKPLYNQYVEIHGFLGCAPYGTFLYDNFDKPRYFIEIFSPGLERQLPGEYFPRGWAVYMVYLKKYSSAAS